MKTHSHRAAHLVCALAVCAAVSLAGCASAPVVIPDDLSAAETFQRAQDATDRGDYKLAIRYYTAFKEKHPENKDRDAWASYEIAFNYHKMGDNAKAIALFDELLNQYKTAGDTLPPAPRILAQELRDKYVKLVKPSS